MKFSTTGEQDSDKEVKIGDIDSYLVNKGIKIGGRGPKITTNADFIAKDMDNLYDILSGNVYGTLQPGDRVSSIEKITINGETHIRTIVVEIGDDNREIWHRKTI